MLNVDVRVRYEANSSFLLIECVDPSSSPVTIYDIHVGVRILNIGPRAKSWF